MVHSDPVSAELWADFTDPFSYLTEVALTHFVAEGGLHLVSRAAELFPAPVSLPGPEVPAGWWQAVEPYVMAEQIQLRPPPQRPRTRKAHEAARFGAERGVGLELRSAIYRAYWRDGQDIGRIDVLVRLGAQLSLDATEFRVVLDIDTWADSVQEDARLAAVHGLGQLPSLLLGTPPQALLLSGLQSRASIAAALDRVRAANV